ncbi:MAG: glucoamylase family protein [Gammaproteobacteria bacterium]
MSLALVAALGLTGLASCQSAPPSTEATDFLEDLEERTFRFFWDTTNTANGLVPDRYPTPSFSSIAAVGFGLTAYPIGVERGYVTRGEARARVLTTLRFLRDAPQGPTASGVTGHRGFFYHFLDMSSGHRFENIELSTIDTALFLAGALFCQSYFDQDHPDEAAIRALADEIYARVDWRWVQARPPAVSMGWRPENGFIEHDWRGYNEAMLLYVLALASPTFPVEPDAWTEWTRTYDRTWGAFYGQTHLGFAPLFGHHYSHAWIDFRGIQDAYMRTRGIDYFENSRRATYAQRAYAAANPMRWKGYSGNIWGLTACDGPADVQLDYAGERRVFRTYSARGAGLGYSFDDGTIAPSAAAGSLPFAPEIALPALREIHGRYGQHVYSTYGFLGSFNPSFDYDVPLQNGRRIPGIGWVAGDYLGIDQGIILAMIENHRSGLIWRVMRTNPHIRRGLQRAGFTGGWLEQ